MASLPEHEQIFLMWLEVCSTTSIIFPDTSASKMDFESGYNEILAYMFKCKYITGIPTNPLSHARDKFDMILIESRDKSEDSIKYDFVHPSYHEAFWYAIHKELPLNRWWDLLKENIGAILEDLKNKVDMVQLRMIERYGAINRDLNQLLLISAECDDPNEQLIAFEHMVERLKQFAHAAQFLNCALSISSSNLKHKQSFLHIVEPHLDRLPLEILNIISTFLFDKEADIRKKAGKIILKHFDNLPESFKLNEKMQIWQTARNIFVPFAIRYPFILSEYFRTEEIPAADSEFDIPYIIDNFSKYSWQWTYRGGLSENYNPFLKTSPSDLQLLLKIDHIPTLINILYIINLIWKDLSTEHKEAITIQKFLSSENKGMVDAAQFLVLLHRDFFSYLAKKYSFIQFQQIFDINIRFEYYGFGLSAIDYYLSRFNETLVQNILEKYDTLSIEQKNTIIDFQSSPRFVKALDNYINEHKYTFKNISDNSLLELLSFHGIVQYYMLPALLIISRKIPNKATHAVIELITNPNDWWIGGSIGQTTRRYFRTMLGKDLKDIPIKLANHYKKQVVGALLAEMAQNHFDKNIGLQEKYVPTLHKLSKDSEALRYAEGWINHKSKTFSIFDKDKEYWAKVKAHLHDLSRK